MHDYGETEDGQPYLVMELIDSESLSDLLREDSLFLGRAVGIVKQVTEAIAEAHRHGIVHRDIKPSNVVLNQRNEVKVLDVGLAKHTEPDGPATLGEGASATHTLEGVVIGTPSYLSPEQALGMPIDRRSDIFAIGSVLYECLTGKPAFSGKTIGEIVAQVIRDDPLPPSQVNPGVPAELDRITLKALAKKTEARYQTAEDLLEDLKTIEIKSTEAVDYRPKAKSLGARERSLTTDLPASLKGARIPVLLLSALALSIVLTLLWLYVWRPNSREPSPEGKRLYQAGTEALRDGSFLKASKFFEQAIQVDNEFPLAHARLAETWIELDYEERQQMSCCASPNKFRISQRYLRSTSSTCKLSRRRCAATIKAQLKTLKRLSAECRKMRRRIVDTSRVWGSNPHVPAELFSPGRMRLVYFW